jgi:hypothetical protein
MSFWTSHGAIGNHRDLKRRIPQNLAREIQEQLYEVADGSVGVGCSLDLFGFAGQHDESSSSVRAVTFASPRGTRIKPPFASSRALALP